MASGINHKNYCSKKRITKKNIKSYNYGNTIYIDTAIPSTHAEEMALEKLKPNYGKKIIKISLLVIRISQASTPTKYTLGNSRPCASCLYKIKNSISIGYKIDKVYFSNDFGNIICYKLRDIIKEKQFVSRYYRMHTIPKKLKNEFTLAEYKKRNLPSS